MMLKIIISTKRTKFKLSMTADLTKPLPNILGGMKWLVTLYQLIEALKDLL